jgi:ABC-type sulfate transport system permease subunit
MFLFQNDMIFVSLSFIAFSLLVLLALGIYMRGLRKIVDGYYKNIENGMIKPNAFLAELLSCLAMPIYVLIDVIDDIIFMWRR